MTKRASGKFKRRERDAYDTPETAVYPLFPHLPKTNFSVWEPCAGSGSLAQALMQHPRCKFIRGTDIKPRNQYITREDAFDLWLCEADVIVTNPPWDRPTLHRMIEHFRKLAPTWLLIDANWMHTKQASSHLEYCHRIVSIGRISWMENRQSGFDDSCWYLFDKDKTKTTFYGRN